MSAGTITVADGWTAVQDVVKNINDLSTGQQLRLADIVDRQIRDEIAAVAPERLLTSTSIAVTAGTSGYALPATFQDVQDLGTGFYLLNTDGTVNTRLAQTGFGSDTQGYYIDGTNVVFTPLPSTGAIVTLKYLAERTDFTVTTGLFCTPNAKRYLELVRQGLLVQYYIFKRRFDLKQFAEADYQALLDDMVKRITQTPQAFSLPKYQKSY